MKLSRPSTEELAKHKTQLEKNKYYIYLKEDMVSKVSDIRKTVGNARSATLDQIRLTQGKIDGIEWAIARPDNLMDELIKDSLES